MPELTDGKAVAFGTFVTCILAATMVVAGLKAGITPGASTLVVLTAWAAFKSSVSGSGGRRFLNLCQVAGSSGMASVSGVIFTMPLLFWVHLQEAQKVLDSEWKGDGPVPILRALPWSDPGAELTGTGLIAEYYPGFPDVRPMFMMMFTVAGACIGYGFVGISTKKFLSDPTLPAPEAHACAAMVTASSASSAEQPTMGVSLGLSTFGSFLIPLVQVFGWIAPDMYLYKTTRNGRSFAITMPVSPVYIGIGGLLTLSTAIVTATGAMVRLMGDGTVMSLTGPWAESFPASTMRWVGGGAMSVGVGFSLIKFMLPREAGDGDNGDVSLLDIPEKAMLMLYSSIAAGVLLVAAGIFTIDSSDPGYAIVMIITIFIMVSLMVSLGAILSLQIGSSASPVSGTVFVTTLVVCLVSLWYNSEAEDVMKQIEGIAYMLVTACVAVSAANDASQDYKTLQLGGIAPRDGFIAQIVGLVAGAVVVPFSFWIAHGAYGLGTVQLPAPQGELFATIIRGILIDRQIPWYPVFVGLAIGICAVTAEIIASKKGMALPAMAFAVGLYLPPKLGLGIVLGAGSRYLGERMHKSDTGKEERTYESILAAAGMITGAAFTDLIVGLLVVSNVSLLDLNFGYAKDKKTGAYPEPLVPYSTAVVTVLFLAWLLFHNSRYGIPEATGSESLPDAIGQQLSSVGSKSNANMDGDGLLATPKVVELS